MSFQHVSVRYVPSSGSVINQVLILTSSGVYSCHARMVCVAVDYEIKLKCGYNNESFSAVHKILYIYTHTQSGSNMTGTNCDLFTHK